LLSTVNLPVDQPAAYHDPERQHHVRADKRRDSRGEQIQPESANDEQRSAIREHATRFTRKKPEHGEGAQVTGQPPGKIPGPDDPIEWQAQPPGKRRFRCCPAVRSVLKPPVSAVGDFVRNISLLGLVVVIEMPWEIADGTQPKHEEEQHALRGLARYETREKVSNGFQSAKADRTRLACNGSAGLPVARWNSGSGFWESEGIREITAPDTSFLMS
jgi:hypothetical protein